MFLYVSIAASCCEIRVAMDSMDRVVAMVLVAVARNVSEVILLVRITDMFNDVYWLYTNLYIYVVYYIYMIYIYGMMIIR